MVVVAAVECCCCCCCGRGCGCRCGHGCCCCCCCCWLSRSTLCQPVTHFHPYPPLVSQDGHCIHRSAVRLVHLPGRQLHLLPGTPHRRTCAAAAEHLAVHCNVPHLLHLAAEWSGAPVPLQAQGLGPKLRRMHGVRAWGSGKHSGGSSGPGCTACLTGATDSAA